MKQNIKVDVKYLNSLNSRDILTEFMIEKLEDF